MCVSMWRGPEMSGFHGFSLHLCVSLCLCVHVHAAGNDAVLGAGAEGEGGQQCVCVCLGSRTGAGRRPAQRASAGTLPTHHQAGRQGG